MYTRILATEGQISEYNALMRKKLRVIKNRINEFTIWLNLSSDNSGWWNLTMKKKRAQYELTTDERFIVKLHSIFLEKIKLCQPLAFMASLSLVIAAASKDIPLAQTYAILATFSFLSAFVFSLLSELIKDSPHTSLISLISSFLGIILLFSVAYQFSIDIPTLAKLPTLILRILGSMYFGISGILVGSRRLARIDPSKSGLKERALEALLLLLMLGGGLLTFISGIVGPTLELIGGDVSLWSPLQG